MDAQQHDVLILGGGISGCALSYLLARYTDIRRIGLIEKYSDIASVNSHGRNNSQTLHVGDIETNYTLEKALKVKHSAAMVERYAMAQPNFHEIMFKYSKMVLGVGEEECQALQQRYEQFSPHFTAMQCLDKSGIAALEPNVVKGRAEQILALAVTDHYSTVNFQELAKSFINQASLQQHCDFRTYMNTRVTRIEQQQQGFVLHTSVGTLRARFVVVSAGGHSLLFAQRMGYGKEYACLPMAGSFYYAPDVLNGKVYTVQNEKLPFAAIHGDPDVLVPGKTRFGPTALVLPMLERYNYKTIHEFFSVFSFGPKVMKVMWDLFKVRDIRHYMFKNFLFEVPLLRTHLFLKDARKIVPTMQLQDLSFAKKIGGIRPVMIDKVNRKLHLGEAKIDPGNGIIFNMTPSPGATSCLQNAEQDLQTIVAYLGCDFRQQQLQQDLHATG